MSSLKRMAACFIADNREVVSATCAEVLAEFKASVITLIMMTIMEIVTRISISVNAFRVVNIIMLTCISS